MIHPNCIPAFLLFWILFVFDIRISMIYRSISGEILRELFWLTFISILSPEANMPNPPKKTAQKAFLCR